MKPLTILVHLITRRNTIYLESITNQTETVDFIENQKQQNLIRLDEQCVFI